MEGIKRAIAGELGACDGTDPLYDASNSLLLPRSCYRNAVKIRRSFRVRVTLIAFFALLFAQLSVAAHACQPRATQEAQAMMTIDCADAAVAAGSAAPNLCAEHCQYGKQGDQPRTPATPVAIFISLYVVSAPSFLTTPMLQPTEAGAWLIAPSPPHTILHCCLRI